MKVNKHIKLLFYTIVFGSVLFAYSFIEARWIRIKNVDIVSEEIPESFDGKKIVFISDIHHGPLFSIERVEKLVARINNLKPDFIFLGGDYVYNSSKYVKPVFEAFSKFDSKFGVFAILGNHEYYNNAKLARDMMQKDHFIDCDNKSYWIKNESDSIKIGGVVDYIEDVPIIDSTIYDLKEENFAILLSHNPDFMEKMKTDKIDLTLSGHTHGGQITLFGLRGIISSTQYGEKYRYGLKKFGKMQAYITSGVGTILMPLRFFCPPEIVVLHLQKSSNN